MPEKRLSSPPRRREQSKRPVSLTRYTKYTNPLWMAMKFPICLRSEMRHFGSLGGPGGPGDPSKRWGAPETLPKGGRVSGAPGAAQTPQMTQFRS